MLRKQPKLDIRPNATDRKIILAGWLLVGLHLIMVFTYYFKLPDNVPVHFNLKGVADGYGPKEILFILPFLSGILYLGMTLVATKVKPHYMNYPVKVSEENAPKLYPMAIRLLVLSNLGSVLVLLVVTIQVVMAIIDGTEKINIPFLMGLIFTLLVILAVYILKMFLAARK